MSKFRTAAIGAVVALGMAGVAGAQTQVQKDSVGRHNGGRHGQMSERGRGGMRGDHGKLMGDLKLTDAQKNQIKTIHTKYEPQFKALRDQGKTQFGAKRDGRQKGDTLSSAARAKLMQEREAFRTRSMAIRQQEQNEVRGILTAEQRTKFDAAQVARKTKMEARQKQMKERGALKKSGKA